MRSRLIVGCVAIPSSKRPMRSVLAAVRAGDHLTVEEIAASAHKRIGSISTQAVYDVLAALVRIGLVRRIEPAGSLARFETRVQDNHHHIICRCCDAVVDVDCAVGHAPCLEASSAFGYAIDEAEIIYWGLCPACRIDS
ncbi:MAG: Fur family transcriptional regulator [Solirubrobacteraceae bacterium]